MTNNTVVSAPVLTDTAVLREKLSAQLTAAGFSPIGKLKVLDDMPLLSNPRLSFGMECLDRDLWNPIPATENLRKLGVRRARLQSGWARTEKVRGVYDFAWLDDTVDRLCEIGIEPWISLSYGNSLWDTTHQTDGEFGLGHVPLNAPEETEAWKRYVAAAVSHYRGKVKCFEIWNEPDVKVFFPYGNKWAEKYAELVKITAPIIREANPDAFVIADAGNKLNLLSILKLSVAEYADAVCFHGYLALPEQYSDSDRRAFADYIARLAPNCQLWRGEAGCPSYNAPTSNDALHEMHPDEVIQAKWLMRHILSDLADPNMDLTSYFHAFNFEHFSHRHRYYYGILRDGDYSRKPSYESLQLLAYLIDVDTVPAYESVSLTETAANVYAFRRHGLPMLAYWRPDTVTNESVYQTATLVNRFIRIEWKNPIVIDGMTRQVYPYGEKLPLADYPMFICEYDAVKDLCDMSDGFVCAEAEAVTGVNEQKIEE